MAIPIKTNEEIEIMRKSGKILADTLAATLEKITVGISTKELDKFAENFIREQGGEPAFKGYKGFPATLCTGVNEVIVHGIPREDEIIADGDLITIDCGVKLQGMYTDAARSVQVGAKTKAIARLIDTAEEALSRAIDSIKPGIHLNEVSKIIGKTIKDAGYHVIHDLTGHGIGHKLHEEPIVLNFDEKRPGPRLEAGMTLAIEPIFSIGSSKMVTLEDDWTLVTEDRSTAVQVEETVLITENGCEILTRT